MPLPLADRIALVTGASRGIGYATALALARAGAHVIAVARTVGGLEELDDAIRAAGGSATLTPLDIRDYDGIYRLAAALNERYGRLDMLVGNAAIAGVPSPLDHIEPKAWDDMMAVNVTANWHLIRAMDPLLKRSDAGRAVFVTSGIATHRPRLLGALFGVQGGARCAGANLRRGNQLDGGARQSVQSRPDPHPHARHGHAGRRPDDAADAGAGRGQNPRPLPAELYRNRQASTISAPESSWSSRNPRDYRCVIVSRRRRPRPRAAARRSETARREDASSPPRRSRPRRPE